MFSIDDREIKRFERELKVFKSRAYPFATKSTVNTAAFTAQRTARADLKENLTLRNNFTVQSVRVEQTRTLDVRRQAAFVGSTADYMADQEFGAIKSKEGKEGVPIATSYAAGQGDNAQPRTRLPRKPNKLQNIRLRHERTKGKGRRQRNFLAVKMAAASGQKYVFLDLARGKGIFRVVGGKRKPRIKMVWNLSHRSVVIPAQPWLFPAVQETKKQIPEIYKKALIFQLKRHGLFRP